MFLVLLTLAPALELRASIPYGLIESELPNWFVFVVCVVVNILLAPFVWLFLHYGIEFFLQFEWIDNLYQRIVLRARERVERSVEKWGTFGLALFIGVPLPGSGVYSGALGAYLLGFKFHQFMWASVVGVLIAGTVVTAVVLSGTTAFDVFLKH